MSGVSDTSMEAAEVHEILRNDRRRATIEVLRDKVGAVSLRNLSETIAEQETNTSPPPRNARESVYNSLHQTHLPKLDRKGVIEYDENRKMVSLGEDARDVYVHMDITTRWGITWADYYRGLGVFALFLVVVGSAGVPVVEAVEPLLVATVFLALFALSTAKELWNRRWLYLDALLNE